ncbi:hypothetical protein FE784_22205 [Paenibacillus hemerocallicola]|uniref:Small peptidoglycan-associated lipoprotein n=1 Tax=Paenibacillus hemerocallicola TaxID=1172614 RepID=A0A5C4T5I1_9BACL|nr:hypothetical protein [Paenibacillus hemerocallicola]TNJ64025.1 hypothetical protein FE784_22205 [Paenibacillus hemerocallicola]
MLFAVTLLLTVNGCSSGKSNVIDEFKADAGQYSLVVFANGNVDNVVKDVNTQIIAKYPNVFQPKGVFDTNKKENKQKAEALGISEYPAYVVIDTEKVAMQTTEIDEVLEMAKKIFNKRVK